MTLEQQKAAYNLRAKRSLRADQRAKTWEQKVESIQRMNATGKIARAAMSKALAQPKR